MRTGYCFLKLTRKRSRHSKDGYFLAPVFPRGVVAVQHCASSFASELALYEYSVSNRKVDWQPDAPVTPELELLLDSAKHYPPALALARDDLESELRYAEKPSSPSELAEAYTKALRHHLQHQGPAVFARAVAEEPGYLVPNSWYWVIGAKGHPTLVHWVSHDLQAYTNLAADFDLSQAELAKLRAYDHHWSWPEHISPSEPFTIVGEVSGMMERR